MFFASSMIGTPSAPATTGLWMRFMLGQFPKTMRVKISLAVSVALLPLQIPTTDGGSGRSKACMISLVTRTRPDWISEVVVDRQEDGAFKAR